MTTFLGPLFGAITNTMFLSLFIYCLSVASGAHLNPTITIVPFFAKPTNLPPMILYVGFKLLGGALAGLLVRASTDWIHFKAGGWYRDPHLVTTRQAFTTEFMSCITLPFLAFGVGLDPRQREVVGPPLSTCRLAAVYHWPESDARRA